jgi:hypothetical protein
MSPNRSEFIYTSAHGIFCRIHQTLGYKTSLNKFKKKIKVVWHIFFWLQWNKTRNQDGRLKVSSVLKKRKPKSTRNHKRGGRTAKSHEEIEKWKKKKKKSRKQSQDSSLALSGQRKLKNSQGKADGPRDRIATVATEKSLHFPQMLHPV